MRTFVKILLWIVVVAGALMTIAGFAVLFENPKYLAAGIFLNVIFISITIGAGVGLFVMRRRSVPPPPATVSVSDVLAPVPQEPMQQGSVPVSPPVPGPPPENPFMKAIRWYGNLLFSASGRRWLRTQEARLVSNTYTRVGIGLFSLFVFAWLIFMIAPIVITIAEVREAVAEDQSNYGPGGMVVFSLFFLTPLWGAVVAAWFAIPSLIFMTIGAIVAKWRLHIPEYILFGVTLLLVSTAVGSALVGSDIYGFYQRWFLPWTVS